MLSLLCLKSSWCLDFEYIIMTLVCEEKWPHWKGFKLWYFLSFEFFRAISNSLCSFNSTQAGAECMCKNMSFLWLIHDCHFYCFMKIRFLQNCRLGKLQPCQAAVLLQQFSLTEKCIYELLLNAAGVASQDGCRDLPLRFARLGEALL